MTSGIIDGVRVSFTQSGGNFSLGSATDASVRSAVSIANGTTVYYVAVGIDANGAEIEREVGEGAISSTGTVITPASRSWSTSGVGVGHTFTAATKVLTLGVTRAMLDALTVPDEALVKTMQLSSLGGGTTFTAVGCASAVSGTPTARATATTTEATKALRVGYVSAAAINSSAHIRTGNSVFKRSIGFRVWSAFCISDAVLVSDANLFCGLAVGGITAANAVGVCSISSSNNLQVYGRDSGSNETFVDLGANFPANTVSTDWYRVEIYCAPDSTTARIRVWRIGTAHVSETIIDTSTGGFLPTSTTGMDFYCQRRTTSTATAVGIDMGYMYAKMDR
jgi:hypothetical protein